jgi:hypothetical protein
LKSLVSITYQIEKSNPEEKNRGNKRDPILKDHSKQGLFLDSNIVGTRPCALFYSATSTCGANFRKIRIKGSSFDRKSVDPSKPEHEEHERERQYDEDPKE